MGQGTAKFCDWPIIFAGQRDCGLKKIFGTLPVMPITPVIISPAKRSMESYWR
jgi:hypothetical protein